MSYRLTETQKLIKDMVYDLIEKRGDFGIDLNDLYTKMNIYIDISEMPNKEAYDLITRQRHDIIAVTNYLLKKKSIFIKEQFLQSKKFLLSKFRSAQANTISSSSSESSSSSSSL